MTSRGSLWLLPTWQAVSCCSGPSMPRGQTATAGGVSPPGLKAKRERRRASSGKEAESYRQKKKSWLPTQVQRVEFLMVLFRCWLVIHSNKPIFNSISFCRK